MEIPVADPDPTETPEGPSPETSGLATAPIGRAARPFVYALGRIDPRFPSLAVEKEFAQVVGRADSAGLTDRQSLHTVLSDRANRYLARQLCWVFAVEGLETYLLTPRDPADLDLLVEAIRPRPDPADVDVVIGVLGPLAQPEACNGLTVPIVVVDQVYSFDRQALMAALPRPDDIPEADDDQFRAAAEELFDSVLRIADNAGATDDHRALNYLAVRYPAIYTRTAAAHAGNASLTSVQTRPSRLSGIRKIVNVVFSYTNRQTDVVEKFFIRVDVTEEFPFLVSKLSPFYDR